MTFWRSGQRKANEGVRQQSDYEMGQADDLPASVQYIVDASAQDDMDRIIRLDALVDQIDRRVTALEGLVAQLKRQVEASFGHRIG